MKNPTRLLRINQVKELTGLSKSSIYERMSRGVFPRQIYLGARTVAWEESSILAWISDQVKASKR